MTPDELIESLERCQKCDDVEIAHADADDLLIEYIGDPRVKEAFEKVTRWYA